MQISVSSTLTLFHDGQFWVGIIEHVEDGCLGAARIVFGAEPSNEEVLHFVIEKWQTLAFGGAQLSAAKPLAANPKRRRREAARTAQRSPMSTKAQAALAEQRETLRQESSRKRKERCAGEKKARFEQRAKSRKEKRRGH